MKLAESWLREWVSPPLPLEDIAFQLTQAGLEVEDIIGAAAADTYENMVVAEILSVRPHPNADRLRLCQVSDGKKTYSVVCGAANARETIKVALALPGARLAQGVKIRKSKIRGEVSEGMLCSAAELALENDSKGILELDEKAQAGSPLAELMRQGKDGVLDIAVMPNRGDCLSVRGLAREVGVLNRLAVGSPSFVPVSEACEDSLPVELLQPQDGCPLYLGRIIKDVNLSRPSPLWLQERLESAGLRPVDPAVDITNYVMLELGQPLHAFDLTKIEGGIRVRTAKAKEKLVLLDGRILELREDDLLIADHEKPLALAGVMGGKDSAISGDTRDIFLEAAFFSPARVQGKQRQYNFTTEAAHRFERGVDYKQTHTAMERATSLFVELLGAQAGPVTEALSAAHLPPREAISCSYRRLNEFLGIAVPREEIRRILQGLAMEIEEGKDEDGFLLTPPSFRFDMDCWEAVGEEIARVHGYDAVPTTFPRVTLQPRRQNPSLLLEDELRNQLAARGYSEVVNYSFIREDDYERFTAHAHAEPLRLMNPISQDMAVMRNNLLAGLMRTLRYNQDHYAGAQKLFEIGTCFTPAAEDHAQDGYVSGAILQPEKLLLGEEAYDFYSLKGDIEALLASAGSARDTIAPQSAARSDSRPSYAFLHPRRSFAWRLGKGICYGGLVHPRILSAYKLKQAQVYLFSLSLKDLEEEMKRKEVRYQPFSRFPPAQRDFSLVTAESLSYRELREFVFAHAGKHLQTIDIFDVYRSAAVGKGKKSLSLRLSWQSFAETLTDEYINEQVERSLKRLADEKGISLREG